MNTLYNRPRIKPIYPLYRLNKKEFRIGAQLGITAEFGDPEGQLWELASRLNGRPVKEVILEMRNLFPELSEEDILEGIKILENEGFLEETLEEQGKDIAERYIANVNYFSRYANIDENRYEYQKKIRQTTILLLGLGGGGSNILTMLAGLGPKKIIIVDYDNVEYSNLGRQLLYTESDIGKPAVQILLPVLEITNGIQLIGMSAVSFPVKYILALSLTAFGGICAAAQTQCMIQKAGFSIFSYITQKLATTLVTSLLGILYLLCFA